MLLTASGYEVIGAATDGIEALQGARTLRPDLILMDIEMPGCDGLAATRLIKAEIPEIKIVMLTVSSSDEHLFEAIKSGASGYLLKSQSADRFHRDDRPGRQRRRCPVAGTGRPAARRVCAPGAAY